MTTADTTTIRRWAHDAGLTTSDRGRLPAKIVDAYSAAHAVPATTRTVKAKAKAASAPGTLSTDKAAAKRPSKSPGAKTTPQRTPVAAVKATSAKSTSAKKQAAKGKSVATAAAAAKTPSLAAAAGKTPAAKVGSSKKQKPSPPVRTATPAPPVKGAASAKTATPRPVKTVAPARRAPVKVARPELSKSPATSGEFAPLHRLVALERQVADLASRLAAVQNRSAPASSNDAAAVAKTNRKFSRR
jgi:hypothetical protein